MSHKYNNPVISALDDIAYELEKTGNADLASLVDEVAAEVLIPAKPVVAKVKAKPAAKSATKPAAKPAAKTPNKQAETNVGARRSRIASAMRKIARAQVSELEDIAQELIKEGDKRAALEVLKIAEDLDSEYEYSGTGKHKAPTSKGDASKVFDKAKANKPDAKMSAEEKEKLETPFGASDAGYPISAKKKSKDAAFNKQLEELIRIASEEDSELDSALPAEDEMDAPAEDAADEDMADEADDEFGDDLDSDEEEGDEDADDADLDGLEGLDMGDEGGDELSEDPMDLGGEGEDELAAMMDAMGEDEDVDASSDRMYDADAAEDEAEEPAFGEEEPAEEDPMADPTMEGEEEDEPLDEEASAMGALQGGAAGASLGALGGPAGAAIGGLAGGAMGALTATVDKKKILALAQKLSARGEKGLAARVARLAKK